MVLIAVVAPRLVSPAFCRNLTQRVVRPVRPRRAYLRLADSATPPARMTMASYLASRSRGVQRSLTTQTDAAMAGITMTARMAGPLAWEHFVVILAHERRMYWWLRAVFAACLRWVRPLLLLAWLGAECG